MLNLKNNKFKKIGILGTLFLFCITSFLNNSFFANASAQSVLNIGKGGTNANSLESAKYNLGQTNTISSSSTDNQFPSSKAVYDYINNALNKKILIVGGAAGQNGKMAISDEQNTWDSSFEPFPTTDIWHSAAHGKNKFVAINVENKIIYSTTGEEGTWLEASSDSIPSPGWRGLTYGDEKFVAVGVSGKIAYSNDGITWTYAGQFGNVFEKVAYGGGKFIAVGQKNIYYSSDGITWTKATYQEPTGTGLYGIAYGNGKFVAVGQTGETAYSTDGITWVLSVSGTIYMRAVVWGKDKFVAVGSAGNIKISYDGITWEEPFSVGSNQFNNIIWTGTQFIAIGLSGSITHSNTGLADSWASPTALTNTTWFGIAMSTT
ncbi:MAG: hypothetical protein LBT85_00725 [Bifidobacteriaceae bacterium]|jgi:hypothetical protein|nr:hypothetical protein [Bifidobacteriaceae bacterium]